MMIPDLVCPQCTTIIPPDVIDRKNAVATCPNCSHTFDLPGSPVQLPKYKTHTIPERVKVYQNENDTLFIINQRHWGELMGMIPFTLIWNGVIWLVMLSAFGSSISAGLCLSLFALVGLVLVHQCAVLLLNHTNLLVDGQGIAVTTKPIPPYHRLAVDHGEIEDVYYVQRAANSVQVNGRPMRLYDYDLFVQLTDGSHQRIFTADDESIALYIGERLKAALNLPGELEIRQPTMPPALMAHFGKRKRHKQG
jgi:hypothetical protein